MRYFEPETVDEALGLLAEHGDGAKVIAGGQSLLILMRERWWTSTRSIGLKAIEPLRAIETNGEARIGAMATHSQVERDPGSPQAGRCCTRPRRRSRRCRCATAGRCAATSRTRSRPPTRRRRSSPPTRVVHLASTRRRRADGRGGGVLRRADADRGRPRGARHRGELARAARRARATAYVKYAIRPLDFAIVERRGAGRGGRGRGDLGRAHRPRRRREPHAAGHRGRARAGRRAAVGRSCSRAPGRPRRARPSRWPTSTAPSTTSGASPASTRRGRSRRRSNRRTVMGAIDFNADLGESFGLWERGADDELMQVISSANVACGFHAGDPGAMRVAVETAARYGVAVGSHPGLPDRLGFGRRGDGRVGGGRRRLRPVPDGRAARPSPPPPACGCTTSSPTARCT